MHTFFLAVQLIIAVLLTIFILLQSSGSGFGAFWRGGGETYHTRRGLEKIVYYATMVCTGLLVLVAVLSLLSQ